MNGNFLTACLHILLVLSKGTDLAKSSNSKECMICHHWCFNHGFKFQDYICNGCHDLTVLFLNPIQDGGKCFPYLFATLV